jgi:Cu/Ag efflux protein CusF
MRKTLLPLALVASLAATTGAFASSAVGTIKAIDTATYTVTLANGTQYTFPENADFKAKLADFKVGDEVTIDWALSGTGHDAVSIAPAM